MDKQSLAAIFHGNYRIQVMVCHYNGGKGHGVTWSTRQVSPEERRTLMRSVLATAARLQGEADDRIAADLSDPDLSDDAFAAASAEYLTDADRQLEAAQNEYNFRQREVEDLIAQRRRR